MCSKRLQHVFFLFSLFLFYHCNTRNPRVVGISISLTDSEEIKNIFRSSSASKNNHDPFSKGNLRTDNFAEGGLIDTNKTLPVLTTPRSSTSGVYKSLSEHSNFIRNVSSHTGDVNISLPVYKVPFKENKSSVISYDVRLPVLSKLNETGTNLFLGVPEVVHLNGISSIKPRKGVYFNKIVPRKGVDIENESNNSLSSIKSCFSISHEDCYSALDFNDTECSCCKDGNYLGKLVQQEALLNCNRCTLIQHLPSNENKSCQNICCKKRVLGKETYPTSTNLKFQGNNSIYNNNFNLYVKNNTHKTSKLEIIEKNNSLKKTAILSENFHKKLKPNITKVPYDVEIVTQLFDKPSKEIFLPVISIFSLLLFGSIFYIIWTRTKEYWNKRYYKRMDFLIDGMYND